MGKIPGVVTGGNIDLLELAQILLGKNSTEILKMLSIISSSSYIYYLVIISHVMRVTSYVMH